MSPDKYGRSTIRNVYYDTDNYRLIRRSIERPIYKEKLRLRSYLRADGDTPVFAELKKKYDHVVYKRRISLPLVVAERWLNTGESPGTDTQITREIDYFLDYYGGMRPTVFLSYDREAYYSDSDPSFRITFDSNILCRRDRLSLCEDTGGVSILDGGMVLMEIKCSGGIPLPVTEILSKEKIYKTNFSKYGTAYKEMIFNCSKEDDNHDRELIQRLV